MHVYVCVCPCLLMLHTQPNWHGYFKVFLSRFQHYKHRSLEEGTRPAHFVLESEDRCLGDI
jgi:hypothetical protein